MPMWARACTPRGRRRLAPFGVDWWRARRNLAANGGPCAERFARAFPRWSRRAGVELECKAAYGAEPSRRPEFAYRAPLLSPCQPATPPAATRGGRPPLRRPNARVLRFLAWVTLMHSCGKVGKALQFSKSLVVSSDSAAESRSFLRIFSRSCSGVDGTLACDLPGGPIEHRVVNSSTRGIRRESCGQRGFGGRGNLACRAKASNHHRDEFLKGRTGI